MTIGRKVTTLQNLFLYPFPSAATIERWIINQRWRLAMRAPTLFLAAAVLALSGLALAQSPGPAYAPAAGWDVATLAGKWTYRSFINDPTKCCDDPDPNKDGQNLLNLLFAEATFTFQLPSPTTLTGAIDWQGGGLDL